MIPVAKLKKDLQASLELADIIVVLKMIASFQFRNISSRIGNEDTLTQEIESCFALLAAATGKNPFLQERKDLPATYVLLCSDEGFVGDLNSAVLGACLQQNPQQKSRFIVLGERGERLLKELKFEYVSFPNVGNDIKMEDTVTVAQHIVDSYKSEETGAVFVAYMKFHTFTHHAIDILQLLPYTKEMKEEAHGAFDASNTFFYPSTYSVTEYLAKAWIQSILYSALWSSKLSEWSIRVMQLEGGADKLKGINKDLHFQYFKAVHSLNDKLIREIFAARTITQ